MRGEREAFLQPTGKILEGFMWANASGFMVSSEQSSYSATECREAIRLQHHGQHPPAQCLGDSVGKAWFEATPLRTLSS